MSEWFGWCSGGGVLAYGEAVAASEAAATTTEKKKVVVLGTGWAGTSFLRNLDNPKYEVHVVSPRNYFAFTPLLPSVTCGTVEARSIVEPVRNIFRKVISQQNTHLAPVSYFCIMRLYFTFFLWNCWLILKEYHQTRTLNC